MNKVLEFSFNTDEERARGAKIASDALAAHGLVFGTSVVDVADDGLPADMSKEELTDIAKRRGISLG